MKTEHRQLLRRLTLSEEAALADVMAGRIPADGSLLDDKTRALVRLAGLIALDARASSLHASIDAAFATGAADEEILEAVLSVAPIVGSSRISSALPRVGRAMERD